MRPATLVHTLTLSEPEKIHQVCVKQNQCSENKLDILFRYIDKLFYFAIQQT